MESGSRNSNQETQLKSDKTESKKKTRQKVVLPPVEEASSFLENIKIEWTLFWAGIAGEEETLSEEKARLKLEDPFETGNLQVLSIEQVKQITRALSQDRKKINQRIEQINREIDINTERLESIKLVGGDSYDTIEEINKLNDVGMKLSEQLEKVSHQINRFRSREDELKGLR